MPPSAANASWDNARPTLSRRMFRATSSFAFIPEGEQLRVY
jgi:hypothetical protein